MIRPLDNALFRRRLPLLALCSLAALVLPAAVLAQEKAKPPRPNIVVLLCDDLGYGDLECYGHPVIRTPHINNLAGFGRRADAFYSAAPVCSPSRVGLLTGRNPNRAGVYDWIPPASGPRDDHRHQVHLRKGEATIAERLKSVGYATCLAGKWHCNSQFNSPEQPQPGDFGFDHWLATQNNAAPSHENPVNFVRNGTPVGPMKGFSCQIVMDEALGWLEKQEELDAERPFFLMVAFHEPHEPVASPPELVAKYREAARNEDEAQYFANIANVDLAVGRLVDHLQATNQLLDTLIVFTSDNGPETLNRYRGAQRSYGSPGPLRGMKLWTTEAGIRVPGIFSWRGHVNTGATRQVVSALDLMPTFCELAGAELPDRPLDGVSLVPFFHSRPWERPKPLMWCYYNAINERRVAMRDGQYKLLAKLDGGELPKAQNLHAGNAERYRQAKLTDFEMYRVFKDLDESENLLPAWNDLAAEMREKLQAAYEDLLNDSHIWGPPPGGP